MEHKTSLGRSNLKVPRMGVGAMTWGDPKGLARLHPAKTAYGGAHGFEEEKRALELSIEAGVNLFDTAAMYSLGAAERRLGELARGRDVLIATKYPSGFSFRMWAGSLLLRSMVYTVFPGQELSAFLCMKICR